MELTFRKTITYVYQITHEEFMNANDLGCLDLTQEQKQVVWDTMVKKANDEGEHDGRMVVRNDPDMRETGDTFNEVVRLAKKKALK